MTTKCNPADTALVRAQALEEVVDMVNACDRRATPRGIAAAIRAMKDKK